MKDALNETPVKNAGLVLANNYLPMLFERLGIMHNNRFLNPADSAYAVRCLHYFVTGINDSGELLLPLTNIICGLPSSHTVEHHDRISDTHCEIMDGLIGAMISHWPSIGNSSIYGFRGNWLIRDGLLSEHHERWGLMVEKRAYDILLSNSPFSFSIIKHPWMSKPLHVTWR